MKKLFVLIILLSARQLNAQWTTSGNVIYNTNSGFVGVGTSTPLNKFEVVGGWIHGSAGVVADVTAPGNIAGFFRGAANGSGNVVLQANAQGGMAFWLSAQNSTLLIGGNGGVEPTLGAINITGAGNVGIGTLNPGSNKLAVEGTLGARAIKVTLTTPWPDYVFANGYKLMSLSELDDYIKANNHLPNIPTDSEVKKDGIDLGKMNTELLKKVEELTLYVIELQKENEEIKNAIKTLSKK